MKTKRLTPFAMAKSIKGFIVSKMFKDAPGETRYALSTWPKLVVNGFSYVDGSVQSNLTEWAVAVGGVDEGRRDAIITFLSAAWRRRATLDDVFPVPPVRRMDIVIAFGSQ